MPHNLINYRQFYLMISLNCLSWAMLSDKYRKLSVIEEITNPIAETKLNEFECLMKNCSIKIKYLTIEFCQLETACLTMTIFLNLCSLILIPIIPQQSICVKQAFFRKNEQKYLANHVIETKQAYSEFECGLHCVADGSCASVNYKTSGIGKGRCELNNNTLQGASDKETQI